MQKSMVITLIVLVVVSAAALDEERSKIIIDADTANEVDDLYAIVRGLIEPSWDVLGLNATQWQVSHWAVEKSMEQSYRLNNVLLSYLQMGDSVRSNRGAEARLFDWGDKSQPSSASNFIIRKAHQTEREKLTVICLGALTNIASAILDDPAIGAKIRLYWLGSGYDFENRMMTTTDFNCVMDIQAVSVILNSDVELHIMPHTVAAKMTIEYQHVVTKLKGRHELTDFLIQRWYGHLDGGRRQRTIWDLALVEAMIRPHYAEKVKIRTSRERGDRDIYMYRDIAADKMWQDFFSTTLKFVNTLD